MAWMGSMFFGVETARRRAAIRNIFSEFDFLDFREKTNQKWTWNLCLR